MSLSSIVFYQVLIIVILILLGFIIRKLKLINDVGAKQVTNILIYLVTPAVIINSYRKEFNALMAEKLLISMGLAILIHGIMILISHIIFLKKTERRKINIFASVYSNCGFMAIPLLQATMGNDGVFYGSAYLAVFTVLYWTHGFSVYSGDKKTLSFKKIILNPGIISIFAGIIIFCFSLNLPETMGKTLDYLANLNTPLSMLILGTYLVNINLKETFKKYSIYLVSFLRLIVFPIIAFFVLKLFNIDETIAKSLVITTACPTAAVTTLFASMFDLDALYSTEIVSVTTLLSVLTIPLVLLLF